MKKTIKIYVLLLSLTVFLIFTSAMLNGQSVMNRVKQFYGTWEVKQSLPIPISHAAGAVVDNRFYIIGGENSNGMPISSVYEYNPENDTWIKKSDSPYAGGCIGCAVADKKIYIFGGVASDSNFDYTCVYDPKADIWENLQKMPPPARRSPAVVSFEDRIFVIGGMAAGYGPLTICDIYIPESNVWSYWRGKEMNVRRDWGSAVIYNNLIYVLGGYNANGSTSSVELYNIKENSWSVGTPLPFNAHASRVEIIDGWIYVTGGLGLNFLDDMVAYNPEQDVWISLPDMLSPKAGHMSCVIDGKLYLAGGLNKSQKFSSLEVFVPGEINVSTIITKVIPDSAYFNQDITIEGYGFGTEKGENYVTFSGIKAVNYYEWSSTRIKTEVPSGAISGDVCVVKDGESSNGFSFKVLGDSPIKKIAASAQSFRLEQNYPNPFNDGTTFKFYIREESVVKLEIYDIVGRKIRSFINSNLSSGEYQCYWNGRNESGEEVAAGQYIVRLLNNKNHSDFIKILYLK